MVWCLSRAPLNTLAQRVDACYAAMAKTTPHYRTPYTYDVVADDDSLWICFIISFSENKLLPKSELRLRVCVYALCCESKDVGLHARLRRIFHFRIAKMVWSANRFRCVLLLPFIITYSCYNACALPMCDVPALPIQPMCVYFYFLLLLRRFWIFGIQLMSVYMFAAKVISASCVCARFSIADICTNINGSYKIPKAKWMKMAAGGVRARAWTVWMKSEMEKVAKRERDEDTDEFKPRAQWQIIIIFFLAEILWWRSYSYVVVDTYFPARIWRWRWRRRRWHWRRRE